MGREAAQPRHILSFRPDLRPQFVMSAPTAPTMIVDGFFADPMAVRAMAMGREYHEVGAEGENYPGVRSIIDRTEPGGAALAQHLLDLNNRLYLPKISIKAQGRKIEAFGSVELDFAMVTSLPEGLRSSQRTPHIDSVAVFGLIYLNPMPRGGTLFFEKTGDAPQVPPPAYPGPNATGYRVTGKIEGRFNRLVFYPGVALHSAEISGDWITDDRRITEPRLTIRAIFRP